MADGKPDFRSKRNGDEKPCRAVDKSHAARFSENVYVKLVERASLPALLGLMGFIGTLIINGQDNIETAVMGVQKENKELVQLIGTNTTSIAVNEQKIKANEKSIDETKSGLKDISAKVRDHHVRHGFSTE